MGGHPCRANDDLGAQRRVRSGRRFSSSRRCWCPPYAPDPRRSHRARTPTPSPCFRARASRGRVRCCASSPSPSGSSRPRSWCSTRRDSRSVRRTSDTAARRTRGASRSNPEPPVPIVRSSGTPRDRTACRTIDVGLAGDGSREGAPGVWPVTREWSRATENLFSAWIEQLFDDPLDAEPELARPARGHARARAQLPPRPPRPRRGRRARAPARARLRRPAVLPARLLRVEARACPSATPSAAVATAAGRHAAGAGTRTSRQARSAARAVERMQQFSARDVAWGVQSGAGRAPGEGRSDRLLPDALSRGDASPGHRLRRPVRAHARRRAPRAADGQRRRPAPRGRRAARRHRRAQALLARQLPLRARSRARQRRLQALPADRRARTTGCGRSTTTRSDATRTTATTRSSSTSSGSRASTIASTSVLSPEPLDPTRAFRATIDALDEQVRARVRSVANGEEYVAKHPETIAMPEGAAIFETDGSVGGLRDAVPRPAPPDRDRRRARRSRRRSQASPNASCCPPAIAGRQVRAALEAHARARGVVAARRLHAQRRLALDADAGRRARRGRRRSRWPTIPTTASRCAGERPRRQRRGGDLPPSRARRAGRAHATGARVVRQPASPAALRLRALMGSRRSDIPSDRRRRPRHRRRSLRTRARRHRRTPSAGTGRRRPMRPRSSGRRFRTCPGSARRGTRTAPVQRSSWS